MADDLIPTPEEIQAAEELLEIAGTCPSCQRKRPWELIVEGSCDYCKLEAQRELDAQAYEARLEDHSWEGPEGDAARLQRNRLLDQWEWTVRRGSPLSEPSQAAFEAFFKALHRITVDFPNPASVQWPEVPQVEYEESENGKE